MLSGRIFMKTCVKLMKLNAFILLIVISGGSTPGQKSMD